MAEKEINDMLSGICIILVMFIIYKCLQSCGVTMFKTCGCGSKKCICNNKSYGMPPSNYQPVAGGVEVEDFDTCKESKIVPQQIGTPGYEPITPSNTNNYSNDMVKQMSLEPEVIQSQSDYINGLGFSGLPQGASHETTLEETGRSYGTSDFVGLTARKFCKARQIAKPASDSRVVPTETIKEWCSVTMDEMI